MVKKFKLVSGILLIVYILFIVAFGYFSYSHSNAYETEASGEVISVYWDELEKERGEYDFSKTDALLSQAKGRGLTTTLAIGFKLPDSSGGEGECRFPGWYDHEAVQAEKDKQLFQMLRTVVNRYEENSSVVAWQVEYDSFSDKKGCPVADAGLLDVEIALVEGVDDGNKQVIVERASVSLGDFFEWVKGYLR
ncbi:MAG: hypothetical protein WDZ40_01910 [Candidatus Spechtbacterales bacterium]